MINWAILSCLFLECACVTPLFVSNQKTLAEHVEPTVGQRSQRELLSPDTSRMVTQLESRIKELKSWLRETELFIFNLNLRPDAQQCESSTQDTDDPQHDPQATKQLQHFKVSVKKCCMFFMSWLLVTFTTGLDPLAAISAPLVSPNGISKKL